MFGNLISSRENEIGFFAVRETKFTRTLDQQDFKGTDFLVQDKPLQNGQLMRVFNSISNAPELMTVGIDFKRDRSYQERQKDFDPNLWESLFALKLPARLQRADGSIIEGQLDSHSEQGSEGIITWSLFDFKNDGYNSLHCLKKGDLLTIFSHITEGNIAWQGRLEIQNQEYDTGTGLIVATYDEDLRDNPQALSKSLNFRETKNIYAKTYVSPDFKTLERLAIHTMPVQIINNNLT